MSPAAPLTLAVDDAEDDLELLRIAWRRAGAPEPLACAHTAEEAVAAIAGARAAGRPFRLVLLDLKMPGHDGFWVLARLAEAGPPRPPVVVMSTSRRVEDVRRAWELGASGYVVKPATLEATVAAVRAVAGFWLDWNVAPL